MHEKGPDPFFALELRLRVEELHARYAHALDADELERWPDLFMPNGRYRITTAENEARGLPLPVLYAEGEAMLRDRIASLRHANRGGNVAGEKKKNDKKIPNFHEPHAERRHALHPLRFRFAGENDRRC